MFNLNSFKNSKQILLNNTFNNSFLFSNKKIQKAFFTLLSKNNINNNDNKSNKSTLNIKLKIKEFPTFSFCEKSNKINTNKVNEKAEYNNKLKKELDKQDKERERQRKIEEWKKLKNSVYTKEEFEATTKNKEEILLIEISDTNKKKLKFFKKLCLFFNIPVSLFITFFIDSILPTYVPGNKKHVALWYGLMATDYILFVNGVLILSALANICLNAKYLPKENMIEFTKLNILNKPFIVKEKIENVKRTNAGVFSPFNSLKSKATNQVYALKGIGEWKDIKLYNYLFPLPVVRTQKTEMKDVKRKKAEKEHKESEKDKENTEDNNNNNNKENIKV